MSDPVNTMDDVYNQLKPLFDAYLKVDSEHDIALEVHHCCGRGYSSGWDGRHIKAYRRGETIPFFSTHFHFKGEDLARECDVSLGRYPWLEIDLKAHQCDQMDERIENMRRVATLMFALSFEYLVVTRVAG